jgi:hypothetical protein
MWSGTCGPSTAASAWPSSRVTRDQASALLGAALGAADRAQLMGGGRYCVASETSERK